MVSQMKSIASLDWELSIEERNLLSVAYKKCVASPTFERPARGASWSVATDFPSRDLLQSVIGARRASWRIVSSIEGKEEAKGNSSQVASIKAYRQKIEKELAGSQSLTHT